MCHFINEIKMSEEHKYIIKLVQILSVKAIFTDEKQEEFLGVIKMESTYIDRYERNLIQEAVMKAKKEIALEMKARGADSKFIFGCTGVKL